MLAETQIYIRARNHLAVSHSIPILHFNIYIVSFKRIQTEAKVEGCGSGGDFKKRCLFVFPAELI